MSARAVQTVRRTGEQHLPGSKRHRAACRDCRDKVNARDRARRLATGETLAPRGANRTREEFLAMGELYGDDLRAAVLAHLRRYPVGLTAFGIARALKMADAGEHGHIRVRRQLRLLAAAGEAVARTELWGDGSARTCARWYPVEAADWRCEECGYLMSARGHRDECREAA